MAERFSGGLQLFRIAGVEFPRLVAGYKSDANSYWRVVYDFNAQALGMEVQSGAFKLFIHL